MAVRAGLIVAIYYLFLVLLLKTDPLASLAISLVGLAIMLPLGYLIDRWRYRSQLRKWQARTGRTPDE
ncbi:MAG: hypothetical protein KDC36_13585 [Thermoleophilia bacterium]|nr:hypothetical protein [Thermoleophilia bacterium]